MLRIGKERERALLGVRTGLALVRDGVHAKSLRPRLQRIGCSLPTRCGLDESKLLSLNTADFGAETRRLALEAYESGDWYGIYAWTKSWITTGGGAWVVDSWLLYVVSALLHGQPKGAVHSADLALANRIEAP